MKHIKLWEGLVIIALIFGSIYTAVNANTALEKADPKVKSLLEKSKLEVVDTAYVKEKIGNGMRVSAKAVLVDARPAKKYMVGHVPSALNIPDTDFEKAFAQVKDMDKNKEFITYCGGWKCAKAPKVAALLKEKGFKNVKVYQEGYPAWKKSGNYSDVSTLFVKSAVKKGNAAIIDARPEKVFTALRIKGAINVPDTQFEAFKDRLPKDKEAKVIVYCGGFKCEKSHIVADHMIDMGYKNVSVYAAGLPAWKKESLPVEGKRVEKSNAPKSDKAAKEFVEAHGVHLVADQEENKGMVYGPWYLEMIKNIPENFVLVDVRSADSYKSGHIDAAISIPFDSKNEQAFVDALKKLNKTVIMNCAAGAMSTEAMMAVHKLGGDELEKKVFYVDANFDCNDKNECQITVNEPL